MSENIKEIASEAIEGAKQSMINRFSGAFTAYLVTTWLAINWSDIALLFMSKVSVEKRIQAIYGQEFFWYQYLVFPVLIGFLLSITIPLINAIVVSLTSYFHARSETVQRRARTRVETELETKKQKKLVITASIEKLQADHDYLTHQTNELKSKSKSLLEAVNTNYRDLLKIFLRIDRLSQELTSLNEKSNHSPEELMAKLNNLITQNERSNAIRWKHEIRKNFGPDAVDLLFEEKPDLLTIDKDLMGELLKCLKKDA